MERNEKGQFVKGMIPWSKGKKTGIIPWNKGLTGIGGWHHSKQTRLKMKNSAKIRIINYPNTDPILLGNNTRFKKGENGWVGRKHSELSKSRMSESHKHVITPNRDTKPERMIQIWLTLNQIKFIKHRGIKFSNNRWVQVDIFIEPNIVIEIDGDYWHANPSKYNSDSIIAGGRYAKEIWAEDIQENHELNKLGYYIIRIWESDIKSGIDDAAIPLLNLLRSLKSKEVT